MKHILEKDFDPTNVSPGDLLEEDGREYLVLGLAFFVDAGLPVFIAEDPHEKKIFLWGPRGKRPSSDAYLSLYHTQQPPSDRKEKKENGKH